MNWKENKSQFNRGGKVLVITPFLRGRVFWNCMTRADKGKEYKAFLGDNKVGEYPTEKEAMESIELRVNRIKDALNVKGGL